jgi:hypothetical protein
MNQATLAAAVAALPFLASPLPAPGADAVHLRGARISFEYTASSDQAALVVEAESETGLDRIEVRDPSGAAILGLRGAGTGRGQGMYGFRVEAAEAPPSDLFDVYPEGLYRIRARTADGRLAVGTARLSHRLARAPVVLHPQSGQAGVPSSDLVLSWTPDPEAAEVRVNLEEGETDRMSVRLAGGTGSFRVPDGVLSPGRRCLLEVGVVGADGNCTIVEVPFSTR